jgi:hypothetical protein
MGSSRPIRHQLSSLLLWLIEIMAVRHRDKEVVTGEKLVRYLSIAIFTICAISGNLVLRSLPDNRLREILLVVLLSLTFLAGLSFAVTYAGVAVNMPDRLPTSGNSRRFIP